MELLFAKNVIMQIITNKITQKERLLKLLEQRGSGGVYVYEIMTPRPNGLGISQYGARILELRRKGYCIENKEPGHFVLIQEGQMGLL